MSVSMSTWCYGCLQLEAWEPFVIFNSMFLSYDIGANVSEVFPNGVCVIFDLACCDNGTIGSA